MKLNIGCGRKQLEGYVNLDILDFGQTIQANAIQYMNTQASVYPQSWQEIRAEHFIEHFDTEDIANILNFGSDMLERGGLFYIVVPHKDNDRSYVLSHKTWFTEETFRFLADENFCQDYGFRQWAIHKLVKNDRPDIHCWLKKI